jgi:di/tripeptidase
VKADGTTFGGDDGIGVATIMAVLQARDLSHGPIEARFTVDEEAEGTGAKGLRSTRGHTEADTGTSVTMGAGYRMCRGVTIQTRRPTS